MFYKKMSTMSKAPVLKTPETLNGGFDMNSKLEILNDSILLRHSFRNFLPQKLEDETRGKMQKFIDELETPFENETNCVLFSAECGKRLYNNGINPPDNMAVFAPTDLVSVSKAGFTGELVMLYAVSLGLTTCWFGHYKLSEVGRYFPGIASPERIKQSTLGYGYGKCEDVGERIICCMPMGYKNEGSRRLVDFVAGKNGAGRKDLEQLLEEGISAENIPENIKKVLNSARLAPSAANSQMWRFGYSENTITVAKPVGYKHFKWEHPDADVGMCAAHIWLGLCREGYSPEVSVVKKEDRAFWTFKF